tara:strand:+ start:57 stop:362 length:306 start_codon:yes stop_codon:yes gene_type:complete
MIGYAQQNICVTGRIQRAPARQIFASEFTNDFNATFNASAFISLELGNSGFRRVFLPPPVTSGMVSNSVRISPTAWPRNIDRRQAVLVQTVFLEIETLLAA